MNHRAGFLILILRRLSWPLRPLAAINRRTGCLILALLAALLLVSCGMLGRLTLTL